jgi:hypothetical protein
MPISDFYADPAAFLQTNIVRVSAIGLGPGERKSTPIRVQITQSISATLDGGGGAVYNMGRAAAGADNTNSLECFFCRYAQNETRFATLTNAATYMFTPQMDGCTFGIGHKASGALIVGHSNAAQIGKDWEDQGIDKARGRQRQSQHTQLQSRMQWNGQFVRPEDYMTDVAGNTDLATTFGVRGPAGWSFFVARYRKTGWSSFSHQGVHAHLTDVN